MMSSVRRRTGNNYRIRVCSFALKTSPGADTTSMTDHISILGLFETHLTVSDLQRSIRFYRDIVGLQLALEESERNAASFWIGDSRHSILGLWSISTVPMGITLHVAFRVTKDDLLDAPKQLKAQGSHYSRSSVSRRWSLV